MKAAAESQRRLLDLQGLDTAIAQVRHRQRTLPETAEAATLQAERARLAEEVVADATRVSDLEVDLARAESDLAPVVQRKERDERRIESGEVTDRKALTGLIDEVAHLKRRISDLEDAQLDVMDRLDAARGALADATSRKTALEDRLRAVLKRREAALAALTREAEERKAEREAVARAIPPELLSLYDKIAARAGGVGAAPLRRGQCGGCQLQITSADLARFRNAVDDEVLRCEECGRVLVRTSESGL